MKASKQAWPANKPQLSSVTSAGERARVGSERAGGCNRERRRDQRFTLALLRAFILGEGGNVTLDRLLPFACFWFFVFGAREQLQEDVEREKRLEREREKKTS